MQQAVGARQIFQLEARTRSLRVVGLAFIMPSRPDNTVWPQRIGHTHHVKQVPASTVVLPLACIRVNQIAPEQKTRDLVVESDAVVAHAYGSRLRQLGFNLRREGVLGQSPLTADLGRDTCDETRSRIGQEVVGRLAIHHHRFTNFVQLSIRTNAGKLAGPITTWIHAEGFVVMPEEGVYGHVSNILVFLD